MEHIQEISPNQFEPVLHWYPKALNVPLHPTVSYFLNLSTEQVAVRYCHMHPVVKPAILMDFLHYKPVFFPWSGSDLIHVTSAGAKRRPVIIETNSCPSGQKSMPLRHDYEEKGGYQLLIEKTFKPMLKSKRVGTGVLAVIYDKNHAESSGYAAAMADVMSEKVYLIPSFNGAEKSLVWQNEAGFLEFQDEAGEILQIRAAFRYVTQKPWNRLPLNCKTLIVNPIIACLAGGRNKAVAAKAYDFMNGELNGTGLSINIPETIRDVSKAEVPFWVNRLGGFAVIKIPYSNAGQGVFTIINPQELEDFMSKDYDYDKFIVQSLIGNYKWSSSGSQGKMYHVGTMPDKKGKSYVCDLRMMIHSTAEGFLPLSIYARRAESPLPEIPDPAISSWKVLGTNLSIKMGENQWNSDANRLLTTDRREFNKIGMGLDDLIESYVQSVLATIAIDKMAENLTNSKGRFRSKLFASLNDDAVLLNEIMKS